MSSCFISFFHSPDMGHVERLKNMECAVHHSILHGGMHPLNYCPTCQVSLGALTNSDSVSLIPALGSSLANTPSCESVCFPYQILLTLWVCLSLAARYTGSSLTASAFPRDLASTSRGGVFSCNDKLKGSDKGQPSCFNLGLHDETHFFF